MNKFIYTALANKRITLFIGFMAAVMGLVSYYLVPKEENPDLTPSIAMLVTIYPGASPADIEKLVTQKIEDSVSEIDGFKLVKSYSRNSSSIVVVKLYSDAEPEKSWAELRDNIDDMNNELPDGCLKPEIHTNLGETAGMLISLSGKNYSYEQLESFAEQFKRSLSRIDGIVRFDIVGKIEKEVIIEVAAEKLNQYDFSLEELHRLLKAQNIEIPSGSLEKDGVKVHVNVPGRFESLRDIENTIISVSRESGAVVRIRDIADVYMDLEKDSFKIRQNGENAVLLAGYFKNSKNIILIGDDVRDSIEQVKKKLPQDLLIDEVLFQPEDVRQAVNGFMGNLFQGMLFVILVVFIGMGFRNALVVATAIPLSILITYIIMIMTGIKVHQISTASLIISLGMLVDNAIVISDAIQVRLDNGMERFKAAYDGAVSSSIPVFTSTLTTVAAFVPLLFIPGMTGQYVISIPQLIITALSASYVVAMLITPVLAMIFFKPSKETKKKEPLIRRVYQTILVFGLRRPFALISIAVLIFASAIYIAVNVLPIRFFPSADKNIIHIDIRSEIFDLQKTEELASDIESLVKNYKEITSYTTAVGDDLPKFYITMMPHAPSRNFAQIMCRVDIDKTDRFESHEQLAYHLQQQIDETITAGKAWVNLLQQAEPMAAPVVLRVSGDDYTRLNNVSQEIQKKLRQIEGTVDIRDTSASETYQFRVAVDNDVANNMGITKYDIQRQINIALRGDQASVFRKAGKEYDIILKSNITSKEMLENLAIKSSIAGNKVLIKQFANISLDAEKEEIFRFNKEYAISVLADMQPGYGAPTVITTFAQEYLPKIDFSGTSITFDGERANIIRNFSYLFIAGGFAMCVIYLILLLQFKSFMQPIVILVTIPLSLIGSVYGLLLLGQPLSFTGFLGVSSLVGIVVNNAILLIEFINIERKSSNSLFRACKDAVQKRFRPIMLSTTTTVMGLLPLAMSGSTLFEPMSISLMSGLLVSTLLTLVMIPVIYYAVIGSVEGKR